VCSDGDYSKKSDTLFFHDDLFPFLPISGDLDEKHIHGYSIKYEFNREDKHMPLCENPLLRSIRKQPEMEEDSYQGLDSQETQGWAEKDWKSSTNIITFQTMILA